MLPNPTCVGDPALEDAELPASWFALSVDGRLRPEKFGSRAAAEKRGRIVARYAVMRVVAVVECVPLVAVVDPYFGSARKGRPPMKAREPGELDDVDTGGDE